jgi:hypothetical protein
MAGRFCKSVEFPESPSRDAEALALGAVVPGEGLAKTSDFKFSCERSIARNERHISTSERLQWHCKILVFNASDLTTTLAIHTLAPNLQPPL